MVFSTHSFTHEVGANATQSRLSLPLRSAQTNRKQILRDRARSASILQILNARPHFLRLHGNGIPRDCPSPGARAAEPVVASENVLGAGARLRPATEP